MQNVALVLDPDLGRVAHDDSLGIDANGLIWVIDSDSSALGYVISGLPKGTVVLVRQFSSLRASWLPDPVSDSAALGEMQARGSRLTGTRDDVRFIVNLGGLTVEPRAEFSLQLIRAKTLGELRTLTAEALSLSRGTVDAPLTAQFRFVQAIPEPTGNHSAQPVRIAASLVPGLSSDSSTINRETIAAAIRTHGINAMAFSVPEGKPAQLRIRIFDASGRVIRNLLSATHEPGTYRLQWDSADDAGRTVGPGVYIALMEAPGFRATTRMVVVR